MLEQATYPARLVGADSVNYRYCLDGMLYAKQLMWEQYHDTVATDRFLAQRLRRKIDRIESAAAELAQNLFDKWIVVTDTSIPKYANPTQGASSDAHKGEIALMKHQIGVLQDQVEALRQEMLLGPTSRY